LNLSEMGFTAFFANAFASYQSKGLEPARVARMDRDLYQVLTPQDSLRAEVSGRLRHDAREAADFPAVGDWVAISPSEGGTTLIQAVLPRATAFTRTAPGRETIEQVVAANVDTAFLVAGLDNDWNLRRLERYLVAARASGARPVIVLNKADVLSPAVFAVRVAETEEIAGGAPVHALSATRGDGLSELDQYLVPGSTVALLGMSGVGKSTIVNALHGSERMATGAVRDWDNRGRHTTTHRELVRLPSGAWMLDTPGMRVLALWGGDESVATSFDDLSALAARCRFGDCAHQGEPGCAVAAALASGELPEERYASWRKLEREARAFAARHDKRLAAKEKARWKAITKSVRDRPTKY
jgi:ribosome biogenesis GTPase